MKTNNETILVLTDVITILHDESQAKFPYAVFEERVPPLGGPPPHSHPDEEIFYVVQGEFEFILNDLNQPFRVLPGSVVHVPSHALHTFKNVGTTQGKMVVLLNEGRLLDYFREIGTPVGIYPDLDKVPDFSQLNISLALKCAEKHQVVFNLPKVMQE